MADGDAMKGALFINTALPFGLWSTPKSFTAIADAAEWIAITAGVKVVLHYLDDFHFIRAWPRRVARWALHIVEGV